MVGGDPALFERLTPILADLTTNSTLMGDARRRTNTKGVDQASLA